MTVGSVFAGIGGLDLGLERAGMSVAWQVENDPKCRKILRRHWPDAHLLGDVTDVRTPGAVGVVCGGFPCQDVSVAGKRRGLAGSRSGLWFEFRRLVDEIAPRWVLVENVPGLLDSHGGRDLGTVLGGLAELGYGWAYRVLDAQYFGVAQRRRRVFIVGRRGGYCPPEVLFEQESLYRDSPPKRRPRQTAPAGPRGGAPVSPPIAQALPTKWRGDPHEGTDTVLFRKAQKSRDPDGPERWEEAGYANTLDSFGDTAGVVAFNIYPSSGQGARLEASQTTKSNALDATALSRSTERGTRIVDGWPRRLTPVECERLQGFPDGWTDGLSDTARYEKLGNAVTVPVAEWIGRRILLQDSDE